MIEGLLTVLAAANLEPDPRELRDALWLAGHIVIAERAVQATPPREHAATPQPTPPATAAGKPAQETAAPAETATGAELFAAGSWSSGSSNLPAIEARGPAVPALRHQLQLARALRPFKRRVPARNSFVVDEAATAARVAEEGIWLPVLRPAPARWLDLALVVDTSPSMVVWRRTLAELQTLAERLGAFRTVRVLAIDSSDDPSFPLTLRPASITGKPADGPGRAPATLIDPTHRRAILVVTDAVGGAWRDGRMDTLLRRWGETTPVAVATVLPQRMWAGTGIRAVPAQLHAPEPGAANRALRARARSVRYAATGPVPIPVMELSARWVARWAHIVADAPDSQNAALLAGPAAVAAPAIRLPAGGPAAEVVRRFRAAASPTAFKLACYLSAAWLNLPVMRLVQRVMLPESDTSHLAEVFLSGLLRAVHADDGTTDPEIVQYDFLPEVRDELNTYLLRDEMLDVLRETSQFVTERFGQPLDFAALLGDPEGTPLPALAGDGGQPLAYVAATVLAKLGGRYRSLASRLATAGPVATAPGNLAPSSVDRSRPVPPATGDTETEEVGRRSEEAGNLGGPIGSVRAVEVLHDRGPATPTDGDRWTAGSGYLIGPRVLLTAAHNVDYRRDLGDDEQFMVRTIEGDVLAARVLLVGDESSRADLALLEISDPRFGEHLPPVTFARVDRDDPAPVTGCWAVGFPRFGEADPLLPEGSGWETWQVTGYILPGDGRQAGLLSLQVTSTPRPLPASLAGSEWEGMSGAVVFAADAHHGEQAAVGVISTHHRPEGGSALTVVPVTAVADLAAAAEWWQQLGVSDPGALPILRGGTETFNERLTAVAAQLGDAQPAVRLAGVYAMAGLADDWPENRQTCVDVLCAYLRMPYEPDPGDDAEPAERTAYRAKREVRHTVIRIITGHLRAGAEVSWQGLNFDFTGVVFDGGDFGDAVFSGGEVSFGDAVFSGGAVSFRSAEFSGSPVSFGDAVFSGGEVSFRSAGFSGSPVSFGSAVFSGGEVSFRSAEFSGSPVSFGSAVFSGGEVSFRSAEFSGGEVSFGSAEFSGGEVSFFGARFSGSEVRFDGAKFSRSPVSFRSAEFSGGPVSFGDAEFSGGQVDFRDAGFSGGQVDFARAQRWSHPPIFDWGGEPPAGVVSPVQGLAEAAPPQGGASAASTLPDLLVRTRRSDHQLKAGTTYSIGRDPTSDIAIADTRVSWRHGVVLVDGNGWIIQDLGSTNGTFLGSQRLDRIEISADCLVRLGNPDDGPALRCRPQVAAQSPEEGAQVIRGEADLGIGDRFLGQGRGRVVLTASAATEYSFEGDPTDAASPARSVFTAALVRGLRTGAADTNRDGLVSVDDAYTYVFEEVQAAGAAQTPQRWLYGAEGQILLARTPTGPAIIPAPLTPELRAGLDSPLPGIRLAAVTELGEWLARDDPALVATARRHLQEVADTDIPRVAQTARTLLDTPTTAISHATSQHTPQEVAVRRPDPQRSRAVLIGTGRYADEKLPDLPVVGTTIADLAAALTDPVYGVVTEDHCTVLEDEGDIRLIGRQLRYAASQAEDLLLVYFVGHALASGRRHELYLGLPDSEWAEPEFNSLEYDKLRSAVLESAAATKIIILDCCFSGRAVSEAIADPVTEMLDQIEVDGTYVLTSAGRDQVALIVPGEDHTAFTGRLLDLLRNGVPDGPELLTVDYLHRQIATRMSAEGLAQPRRSSIPTADLLAFTANRAFAPPQFSTATPPAADPLPEPRLALVVATSTYTDSGLRQLRDPAREAADLAQALADPGIGGFAVTTVIDQSAQQVRLAIEDFLDGRGTGDLLLVYLSCHGLLDARGRLYFATTDTRKDRLGATGVAAAWIADRLDDCRARRQVLILDCSFSGAFAHGAK